MKLGGFGDSMQFLDHFIGSSSVVTLARPSNLSRLQLTNISFYHTAPAIWNNLPIKLHAYARNSNSFALSASQFLKKLKNTSCSSLFSILISSSSLGRIYWYGLGFVFVHLTGHFHLSCHFISWSLFILFYFILFVSNSV
jgi:hypothetical protein